MHTFCDIVRSKAETLDRFLGSEDSAKVLEDSDHSCSIVGENIQVSILCDPRGSIVSSTILFDDPWSRLREPMDTHILARLFPDIRDDTNEPDKLPDRVQRELEKISDVLRHAQSSSLTFRDLYYFFRGYNQGYTSAMSA